MCICSFLWNIFLSIPVFNNFTIFHSENINSRFQASVLIFIFRCIKTKSPSAAICCTSIFVLGAPSNHFAAASLNAFVRLLPLDYVVYIQVLYTDLLLTNLYLRTSLIKIQNQLLICHGLIFRFAC